MNRKERRAAKHIGGAAPAVAPVGGSKIDELLRTAQMLHQGGRLAEAVEAYAQAIQLKPNFPPLFNNLGAALMALGRAADAVVAYRQAIALQPNTPETHNNLGLALAGQRNLTEAEGAFRKAVALRPDYAEAYANLGQIVQAQGRLDDALVIFDQAIARQPGDPAPHNNKGLALYSLGRFDEALASFANSLAANPNHAAVHNNLGLIHAAQGRLEDAAACYATALKLNPLYAEALNNLGIVRLAQGKPGEAVTHFEQALMLDPGQHGIRSSLGSALRESGRLDEAVSQFQMLLSHKPDDAEAHNNLGVTRHAQGRFEIAIEHYQLAAALKPDFAEAFNNWGISSLAQSRFGEALACFGRAVAIRPDYVEAHGNLAQALREQGSLDEAVAGLERAVTLKPGSRDALERLAVTLNYSGGDPEMIARRHFQLGRVIEERFLATIVRHANAKDPARRLRIGYVSPDFREHSVSYFLEPLLAAHDRAGFEIFCYADVHKPDAVTARLRQSADHFHVTIGWSDDDIADRVRADSIDILVDLAGHTAHNRLAVFARRPAPVQITWLGYPNTTGLTSIEYRLVDGTTDPLGAADELVTEKLIRLDGGFLCYQPSNQAPSVAPAPVLATGSVTFGSFNNPAKLSAATLDCWASLLTKVPAGHLVLKGRAFGDPDGAALFLSRMADRGIAADRITMLGEAADTASHLALYRMIDIALDPFPYNGTTTTCEALWMGVPVVTLAGDTHAGRVGASLMTAAGLPEFIAADTGTYIEIAAKLAGDTAGIVALRTSLRERLAQSALCDAPAFATKIERTYRQLWQAWCGGDDVSPATDKAETSRAEIAAAVARFPFWYHRIPLPQGEITPGWAPLDAGAYRIPARLDGMRVLDVGAWDGFWTFEALRRGAREVVAIDDFSDFLGNLKNSDRRAWETFDLCRDLLGYDETRCKRVDMTVYDVTEARLGRFDIVFFFGTLYHLRHPLLALDALSSVCDGEIFVETAILDDFSPYRGGLGHGYSNNDVVAEFYPRSEYGNNDTNWWVPTVACLTRMVEAAGFDGVDGWKLTDTPQQVPFCRGFAHGKKG